MKTIWVILPWADYEGASEPLAAFTTRRKAETWLRRYETRPFNMKDGNAREIHQVDLDPVLPPPPKGKKPRRSSRR